MIFFFTSICVEQRSVLCSSIMSILFMVVILRRLITRYLLLSMIILGGTGCFLITTIEFWIIFTTELWLTLKKNTWNFFSNKNIVRKIRNEWKTFDLIYYWPACGKTMSLPMGYFILFNAGFVPTIFFCHCLQVIFYQTNCSYSKSGMHHYIYFVLCF